MNKRFSRIAMVGKVEDARVADSMVALARHLRSRGLVVLVDTNTRVAEAALEDGTCPTRIVSMPMTKVWAKAATTSSAVATRLAPNVRRANCTTYAAPAAAYRTRRMAFIGIDYGSPETEWLTANW